MMDVIVVSYRDVSMFSLLHQKKLHCFCDRSVREMACRSRKRVAGNVTATPCMQVVAGELA